MMILAVNLRGLCLSNGYLAIRTQHIYYCCPGNLMYHRSLPIKIPKQHY